MEALKGVKILDMTHVQWALHVHNFWHGLEPMW